MTTTDNLIESIADTTGSFIPAKNFTNEELEAISNLLESEDKEIRDRTIPFLCRILVSMRDKRIFEVIRSQFGKERFYEELDRLQ